MKGKAFQYEVAGRAVKLEPSGDAVAVRFREPAPYSARARVAEEAELGPFSRRFEVPGEKFTVFPLPEAAASTESGVVRASARLEESAEVTRYAPVFKLRAKRILITDRIIVCFKRGGAHLLSQLEADGFQAVERVGDEYVLRLPEDVDPLAVTQWLSEQREAVAYAEPDFVTIGVHPNMVRPQGEGARNAGGPYQQEYALGIIGADRALARRQGDPAIKVAILDDGIDVRHQDLADAVCATYDATYDGPLGEINSWDSHGTACAGLAAGTHRNALGVLGVGVGCSLLAVRIAYTAFPGGPWVTTSSNIRRGIDWAVDAGAAVLSNSWGGGAPSNAVLAAFERARTQGRGGLRGGQGPVQTLADISLQPPRGTIWPCCL